MCLWHYGSGYGTMAVAVPMKMNDWSPDSFLRRKQIMGFITTKKLRHLRQEYRSLICSKHLHKVCNVHVPFWRGFNITLKLSDGLFNPPFLWCSNGTCIANPDFKQNSESKNVWWNNHFWLRIHPLQKHPWNKSFGEIIATSHQPHPKNVAEEDKIPLFQGIC